MKLSDWFKGFEKGIARLSPEQRSAFFSECGKNCVNGGTLCHSILQGNRDCKMRIEVVRIYRIVIIAFETNSGQTTSCPGIINFCGNEKGVISLY